MLYTKMARSGNQTEKGKAFEFACAQTVFEKAQGLIDVELQRNSPLLTAERCYSYLELLEKENYIKAAQAAVKIIDRLEPRLFNDRGKLVISLQTDSAGISGDVRDVLCARGSDWQIGLSCKHNHEAVKHSRLSDTIDLGRDWFGLECSRDYFSDIHAVFQPLRKIRDDSVSMESGHPALWIEIPDKEDRCYVPALNAFMKELKRLDKDNPGIIPERLIRYLIGRNDFYKVIMNDSRRFTQIESININGTLNKPVGTKKALIDVPLVRMPTKFYEIGFKDNSKNTIFVVCDQGWNVSMRIHNASSRVEPSLKFDVQLLAMPSSILTQIEPWD